MEMVSSADLMGFILFILFSLWFPAPTVLAIPVILWGAFTLIRFMR